MTPYSKLMLLASRLRPGDSEIEEINTLLTQISDWDKTVRLMIARQAGPFLYKKLSLLSNKSLIPDTALQALRQSYLKTISRNMVLAAHFGQVMNAFNEDNIPVIAMKGIYLSEWLYKDLGLRQCSDIDLLVKLEDGERALEVLRKLGFQSTEYELSAFIRQNTEDAHYPPMIRNGVSIEVHTKVHKSISPYTVDLNTLWSRSETKQVHGVEARVFSLTDQLITIAIHLEKHFDNGQFQFTGFYDLVWLLSTYGSEIDWHDFEVKCEIWNTKSIYRLLYLTHQYFGAPIPEFVASYKLDKHTIQIFNDCLLYGSSTRNLAFKAENRVKNIDGVFNKVRYLLYYLVPAPSYMIRFYKLNSKGQLFYYYPYRVLTSLWAGVKYLGRKK